jgi:antitoxin VapB
MIHTMSIKRAKVFQTGRSQAVRLPKEFRFEGDTVLIRRKGSAVILEPDGWPDGYALSFAGIPDNFGRGPQGTPERREEVE